MSPFESRLNRRAAWVENYMRETDDKRTRVMYRDICWMLIICSLVTGFIGRLAQ